MTRSFKGAVSSCQKMGRILDVAVQGECEDFIRDLK
jgi:hypothetical protein